MYSFLLSGGNSYEKYERFLRRLNMPPYSQTEFDKAMSDVLAAVMKVLDGEIEITKEWLKENDLFYRAILGLDGSWCTPGAAAPHGMFAARSLAAFGALLGYHFMSRNDPKYPWMATSAAMEVIGCMLVLIRLCGEGLGREFLKAVCDGDTNAGKLIAHLWSHFTLLACSGHMNKNLGQCVDVNSKKKCGVKGIVAMCVCVGKAHRFSGKTGHKPKVVPVCGIDGSKTLDETFVKSLKVYRIHTPYISTHTNPTHT